MFKTFLVDKKKEQAEYTPLTRGKVLCIADLHSFFAEDRDRVKRINFTKYKAVFFLGDIKKNDAAYIAGLIPPGVPSLYVHGNHDEPDQYRQIPNLVSVDGETYTLQNEITIGGAGGSRKTKHGDLASGLYTRKEKEIREVLGKIGGVDILVTHESPFHLLSTVPSYSGYRAVTKYIKKNAPFLHIYGHHHYSNRQMVYDTLCICVYGFAEIDLWSGEILQLPGF